MSRKVNTSLKVEGHRLYTLDAVRGLLAIAVACYHLQHVGIATYRAGQLSVDFFFGLSGLVLGIAYQERLAKGMTVKHFALLRLVRLWPLYMAGTFLGGVVYLLTSSGLGRSSVDAAIAIVSAVAMLPNPISTFLYPANPPAWSLFFELLINVVFAGTYLRLRPSALIAIAVLALIAFAAVTYDQGSNPGVFWHSMVGGIARVTCSFTVGVLIARQNPRPRRRMTWLALFVPVLAIVPLFLSTRSLTDMIVITAIYPATLIMGTRLELPARTKSVCEWLGDLSYPLYAVHFPILFLWHQCSARLGLSRLVEGTSFILVAIVAARLLMPFDSRVRAWLAGWLHLTSPTRLAQKADRGDA